MKNLFDLNTYSKNPVYTNLSFSILSLMSKDFKAKYTDFVMSLPPPAAIKIRDNLKKIRTQPTLNQRDQAHILLIGVCIGSSRCLYGLKGLRDFSSYPFSTYLSKIVKGDKNAFPVGLDRIPFCLFFEINTSLEESFTTYNHFLLGEADIVSTSLYWK